jgi:hypothetical protein
MLFRADVFNLLNTPSLGQPSDMTIDSTGGTNTGPRSFQRLTPDARLSPTIAEVCVLAAPEPSSAGEP